MDWPNLNTADSVGRVCGLVKAKRGRAYRLPAKIIGNVVHEVKQNKENQESAVFLNSRPLRLPFGCRMSDMIEKILAWIVAPILSPNVNFSWRSDSDEWGCKLPNWAWCSSPARSESQQSSDVLPSSAWNRVCVSRTKAVRRRLNKSFLGQTCMRTPGVLVFFVQLTLFGPAAAQLSPSTRFDMSNSYHAKSSVHIMWRHTHIN